VARRRYAARRRPFCDLFAARGLSRAAVLGEKATAAENIRCDDANRDATKATEPGAGTHHKASQAPGRSVHIAVARFRSSALTGFQVVLDHFAIAAAERTGVMILLAPLILIAAVWQAVGLGVAGAPMLMKGINLER